MRKQAACRRLKVAIAWKQHVTSASLWQRTWPLPPGLAHTLCCLEVLMQRTNMQNQTTYLQQVLEGALRQALPVPVRFLHLTLAKRQLVTVHLHQPLKVHLVGDI